MVVALPLVDNSLVVIKPAIYRPFGKKTDFFSRNIFFPKKLPKHVENCEIYIKKCTGLFQRVMNDKIITSQHAHHLRGAKYVERILSDQLTSK